MNRTLLYTANADSIESFYGYDADKWLRAIYNADDRLTARRQVRYGDPDNELDGELFIIVDEDGEKDADLRNEISDLLIQRIADAAHVAEAAPQEMNGIDHVAARVRWGGHTETVSVRLMGDGSLDSPLDWSVITDDDGAEFAEWLASAKIGDTFRWHAPVSQ